MKSHAIFIILMVGIAVANMAVEAQRRVAVTASNKNRISGDPQTDNGVHW